MAEYIHKHKNQVEAITKLTESVPQDVRIMPDGRIMILGATGFWITEDFSSFSWTAVARDNQTFRFLSKDLVAGDREFTYAFNGTTLVNRGASHSNRVGANDPYFGTSTHGGAISFGGWVSGTLSNGNYGWIAKVPRTINVNNGSIITASGGGWLTEHPIEIEGGWLLIAGGANGKSSIVRVIGGTVTMIRSIVAYGNHQGRIARDSSSGRIWVTEKTGSTDSHIIYSDDEGLTWSEPQDVGYTLTSDPDILSMHALPDDTLLMISRWSYFRVSGVDGSVLAFTTFIDTSSEIRAASVELPDSRILVVNAGSGVSDSNVFIFGSVNPITEAESFETVYMATDTPLSFLRPPDTAKFTIDDGTAEGQQITLEVDWPLETTPDFDMRVPGVYVMKGYPKELPKGIANPDNIGAEYTITVIPGSCYRTQPICASWPVPAMPDVPRSIPQDPIMLVRWRSDGKGKWSKFREISLGQPGDSKIVKRILGLGRYRTRQYEIIFFGNVPLSLMSVEEEVKLGGPSQ